VELAPEETSLVVEAVDDDPNADTHPDRQAAAPAAVGDADADLPAGIGARDAGGPVLDPLATSEARRRAIDVGEMSGSPDDEISIQTGAESLFDLGGQDLSTLSEDDEEA